jgi:hypothetical protein
MLFLMLNRIKAQFVPIFPDGAHWKGLVYDSVRRTDLECGERWSVISALDSRPRVPGSNLSPGTKANS